MFRRTMLLAVGVSALLGAGYAIGNITESSPAPAHCTFRGDRPDPSCTPGATNPAVTQANIHTTICVPGYATSIRPPLSWSNRVKLQVMTAYSVPRSSVHVYELDHLIPLSLGGAPQSLANLWPEAGSAPNPKDKVEGELYRQVCQQGRPLADAQRAIARDWHTAIN